VTAALAVSQLSKHRPMENDGVVPLFRNLSPVLPKQLVARGSSNIHLSTTSDVVVSVDQEKLPNRFQ